MQLEDLKVNIAEEAVVQYSLGTLVLLAMSSQFERRFLWKGQVSIQCDAFDHDLVLVSGW